MLVCSKRNSRIPQYALNLALSTSIIILSCALSQAAGPSEKKTIDIIDFIALFSIPSSEDHNILPWHAGAEQNSPVRWETVGAPHGKREGAVVLLIDGHIPTVLKETIEPLDWNVTVTGPKAGINVVRLWSYVSSQEIQSGAYTLMKERNDVSVKVLACDSLKSASVHILGIEYQFKTAKKAWMIETISCGSAGCSLSLSLFTDYDGYKKELAEELPGGTLPSNLCEG